MRYLIVLALAGCAAGEPGAGLDVPRALAHVGALTAFGPRPQDSDGSRAAAGYIEDELRRIGLDPQRVPVGDVDLPAITVLGATFRHAHRVHTTDPDLVVRLGPHGPALLVMAHYDTVPGSPGAIDNAVAVGVLLELARALRDEPPDQPVLLAFTANEEIGLVGAEALAARGDVDFAIALDLIGGDGRLTLNGASELIGDRELGWLADAADRAGVVLSAPLAHRVISRWWPQAERSDHGAFTRRGVRAIHFYNRGNDGEWIDLAYHSPRDVPARIDRAALDEVGRLLRALVASKVPAHDGDGFWLPLVANVVVPRWLLVVVELVLVLVVIGGLARSLVDHLTRDRARERGAGLLAAAACYIVAVVAAIAVERMEPYPASWLHAPGRALACDALVLVGVLGLATRAVARFAPWRGGQRYLACAAIAAALVGIALLVIGAAELAWIWLVPAAAIVLAPRLGALAIPCAVLPIALVLHPAQLREAAWNGFLPPLPLAVWLGFFAVPVVATSAWWLRKHRTAGPLGTLVLGMGCGLAVIVGLVVAITFESPCSAVKFDTFGLGCERV